MWNHLRAALILFHVVAITAMALPSPKGLRAKHLRHPEARRLLRLVSTQTGAPVETLREQVLDTSTQLNRLRRQTLAPFRTYYVLTGTQQSWRMFGVIDHTPARIEIFIEPEADAPWRSLFIERSSDATWNAQAFNHTRFRIMLSRFGYKLDRSRYLAVVSWIAREATTDYPDAARVRVQLRPRPLPSPERLRRTGTVEDADPFWVEVRAL